MRVIKAAPQAPAFAASLNISGANIGIGLGAAVGGHFIDSRGLASLGTVAAVIVLAAVGLAIALVLSRRPSTPRPAAPAPGIEP
ncbi:sugar efflux transporter [Bordetella pertussis]|nr:sugar efflux transporter [Bordetella pertussis]